MADSKPKTTDIQLAENQQPEVKDEKTGNISGTLTALLEKKKAVTANQLEIFEKQFIEYFEDELMKTLTRISDKQQRSYSLAIGKIDEEISLMLK